MSLVQCKKTQKFRMQSIIYFFVILYSNMDMIGDATVWKFELHPPNNSHVLYGRIIQTYLRDLREF